LELLFRVAGDLERLVHDVGTMVADGTRRQLHAVADDVVLERLDRERVLAGERFEPALRHREWVVAEVDLPCVGIELVHWEIDDPAEFEHAGFVEVQLAADADARLAGEFRGLILRVADEEDGVAVLEAHRALELRGTRLVEELRDRALPRAAFEHDVAQAPLPLLEGGAGKRSEEQTS